MPDFRCHCESPLPHAELIALSPEESLHLVAANRARQGDTVVAFDGAGNEWVATVEKPSKREAVLRIRESRSIPAPTYRIALGQALPKGKLFESIIKKATEIGATDLFPVLTSRVETKIAPEKEGSKNAKWQAAAIEGAKQSGNPYLPAIAPVTELASFLENTRNFDLKLLASLRPDALPLRQILARHREHSNGAPLASAIWLIGPEGDLTEKESEAAIAAGFLPASLGPHVMRCETAAIFALSVIAHELR